MTKWAKLNLKETREKLADIHRQMKRMLEEHEQRKKDGQTSAESWTSEIESRWQQLNEDYEAGKRHVEQLENERKRAEQLLNQERFMGGGGASRRPLSGRGRLDDDDADLTAHRFRNVATGQEVRCLLHGESLFEQTLREQDLLYEDPRETRMDVGRCLQALVTNRFDMLTDAERRAMLSSVDSGGGYLLDPVLSARFLDLARSASVVMRAGAQTIPMESSEMHIARLATDPTSEWRPEGVAITASDVTFDRITMRPKTLGAVIPVPIELMDDAQNIGDILAQALRNSMGLKLDQAALTGTGAASEPKGIRNHDDVNTIASVGAPTYDDITDAVGDILNANYAGELSELSWIMHPRDGETFAKLKDGQSQPIAPPPWAEPLRRFRTTSLPTDEGGGSNESVMIVGDFRQVVMAMRTSRIVIRILDSGQVTDSDSVTHNAASELKRFIVAYLRADVAILRPTFFTNLTGVTT